MASVTSVAAVFCLGILCSDLPCHGGGLPFWKIKAVAAQCSHLTGIMCLGLNDALSHVTWPPSHGFSNLMGITSSCFAPLMNLPLCCVYAVSPHTSKDNLSSTVCGRGHRPGKSSHSHRAGIMVLSIYVGIAAFPSVVFLLSSCT